MKILEYTLTATAPMFLGNAQQEGQWRSPAIKALIRHWWRVVQAAKTDLPDYHSIREREVQLFGNAGNNETTRKSRVRVRLGHWNIGTLKKGQWAPTKKVPHPEVDRPIGTDLYLGYGPLKYSQGKSSLKANAAIQANESNTLSVAMPDSDLDDFLFTFALINAYGTLGGRSRNGWGSIVLSPIGDTPSLSDYPIKKFQRDWCNALDINWPHAIGKTDSACIWQTSSFNDWRAVIEELAVIKITLRTRFRFTSGKNPTHPEERHWLSHPVTSHKVQCWRGGRLPNTLRFKVRPCPISIGNLRGVIFHMPCLPPQQFKPENHMTTIKSVWSKVYDDLDSSPILSRIPA